MLRKNVIAAFALTLAVAACGPGGQTGGGANTVSGEGYGRAKIGMTLAEAEKALGVKLATDGAYEDEICRYAMPVDALDGIAFMTSNGLIVRVDVSKGDTATAEGAKIGDSEQRVLDLYKGRVEVQPHKYTGPEGHYLVVKGSDGKVQIVFETDGKTVVSYRAGQEPQVEYIEGCS